MKKNVSLLTLCLVAVVAFGCGFIFSITTQHSTLPKHPQQQLNELQLLEREQTNKSMNGK